MAMRSKWWGCQGIKQCATSLDDGCTDIILYYVASRYEYAHPDVHRRGLSLQPNDESRRGNRAIGKYVEKKVVSSS